MRRGEHLPAQSHTEQVQDVHSRQGRLDAAWSRRALALTYTSFTLARSLVCTFCVSFVATRSRICQTTLLPFVSFPPHRYTHAITNTNTHTHTHTHTHTQEYLCLQPPCFFGQPVRKVPQIYESCHTPYASLPRNQPRYSTKCCTNVS